MDHDTRVSDFILRRNKQVQEPSVMFSIEKLQAYVALIKARFRPRMSPGASVLIQKYYHVSKCRGRRQSQHHLTLFW